MRYTAGSGMVFLGTFGGSSGQAWDVNSGGIAVGYAYTSGDGSFLAFKHDGVTLSSLGTLGGSDSDARAINDQNQIVGYSHLAIEKRHAFRWNSGVMQDIGALPGFANSIATGINNNGVIVGFSHHDYDNGLDRGLFRMVSTERAFLYKNNQMMDLTSMITGNTGWVLTRAFGINDNGQIVGYGLNPEGNVRGFLLTSDVVAPPPPPPPSAVPEPGSIMLLTTGAVAVGVVAAFRKRWVSKSPYVGS